MKNQKHKASTISVGLTFISIFIFVTLIPVYSAYAVPIPDGMIADRAGGINILARGDEHYSQFYVKGTDGKPYTVVKDKKDGKWFYAVNDKKTGRLIPGRIKVDITTMPPAESKGLMPKGKALLEINKHLDEFNKVMDTINKAHLKTLAENRAQGERTVYQAHIVFVEFPDVAHTYQANDFLRMIYSDRQDEQPYLQTPDGIQAYGSVRDYWHEVSFDQVDFEPIVHFPQQGEWFIMPHPKGYYTTKWEFYTAVINVAGLNLNPQDKLIIVPAGEATGGVFWPHVNYLNGNRMVLTELFSINFQYRFLAMGVAAHEFGHMFFGIPDYGYSTSYWCLMGLGCYGYGNSMYPNSEKPVHLSAIGRIRAGLADVQAISGEGLVELYNYVLPPAELTGKILHLDNEDNDTDFYLECRQNRGSVFDSDITGESAGLVVWFTFDNNYDGHFPIDDYNGFIELPIGYFNASEFMGQGQWDEGYWGPVTTRSAFPGQYNNTEIGYNTLPPFMGNRYTHLHHMTNIKKGIEGNLPYASILQVPINIHFNLERFYFNEQFHNINIDDDNEGLSQGNGNGIPEVGERIEVNFRIENHGSQFISASSGLFETDEDMECLSDSFVIPEIAPGAYFDTPTIVFDILSEPIQGGNHKIRLMRETQFILSRSELVPPPPPPPPPPTFGEEYRITYDGANQINPSIYGNKIVWEDKRNGSDNADIYLYELGADGIPGTGDPNEGEYRVTYDSTNQINPSIYGNKIVWQDYRNGVYNLDIYLYELGADGIPGTGDPNEGEYRVTYDSTNQKNPSIYGNKIAWEDSRHNYGTNLNIYLYELGADGIPGTGDPNEGEYRITYSNYMNLDRYPSIYSNKIVWLWDYNYGSRDIYMYELGADGIPGTGDPNEGEYSVTDDSANQNNPSIYGNKIVWDFADIYLYELGADGIPGTGDPNEGEYRITYDGANQKNPSIYGNKIVWEDKRNGSDNADIYLYELGADGIPGTGDPNEGEYRVTYDSTNQKNPSIYGNKIVWEDYRNGNTDIYLGILPE